GGVGAAEPTSELQCSGPGEPPEDARASLAHEAIRLSNRRCDLRNPDRRRLRLHHLPHGPRDSFERGPPGPLRAATRSDPGFAASALTWARPLGSMGLDPI